MPGGIVTHFEQADALRVMDGDRDDGDEAECGRQVPFLTQRNLPPGAMA